MIIFTTFTKLTGAVFVSIASWRKVFPDARIVIFGCKGLGSEVVWYCPAEQRGGLPLVNDMFRQALEISDPGPFLFINGDIVITDGMKQAAEILSRNENWLATGQRREVPSEACTGVFDALWETKMLQEYPDPPRLATCGADWFLFDRLATQGMEMPPFAIARTCYDNWLIYDALERGVTVVDCTEDVIVYHQTHPEQPVRRSDEAKENFRLAKQSYPRWNEWSGWIRHAKVTLHQLKEHENGKLAC